MDPTSFGATGLYESEDGLTDWSAIHRAFLNCNKPEDSFLLKSFSMPESSTLNSYNLKHDNDIGYDKDQSSSYLFSRFLSDGVAKCIKETSTRHITEKFSEPFEAPNKMPNPRVETKINKNQALSLPCNDDKTVVCEKTGTNGLNKIIGLDEFLSVALKGRDNYSEDSNDTRTSSFNTLLNYQIQQQKQKAELHFALSSTEKIKKIGSTELASKTAHFVNGCDGVHNIKQHLEKPLENEVKKELTVDAKNALPVSELTPEIFALIPRNEHGQLLSYGSIGHALGTCKACVFFHNPGNGCQNKERCLFCHYQHVPKKRMRLSKKKRAELRSASQNNTQHITYGSVKNTCVPTFPLSVNDKFTSEDSSLYKTSLGTFNFAENDLIRASFEPQIKAFEKQQTEPYPTTPGASFSTTFTSGSESIWDEWPTATQSNHEFLTTFETCNSSDILNQSEDLWNSFSNCFQQKQQLENHDFSFNKYMVGRNPLTQDKKSLMQKYSHLISSTTNENKLVDKLSTTCKHLLLDPSSQLTSRNLNRYRFEKTLFRSNKSPEKHLQGVNFR